MVIFSNHTCIMPLLLVHLHLLPFVRVHTLCARQMVLLYGVVYQLPLYHRLQIPPLHYGLSNNNIVFG